VQEASKCLSDMEVLLMRCNRHHQGLHALLLCCVARNGPTESACMQNCCGAVLPGFNPLFQHACTGSTAAVMCLSGQHVLLQQSTVMCTLL
jgi:hypothetical protein